MAELSAADFEALSAYVDGALAPTQAAELATRIAGEPALAVACARLSALKVATSACLAGDAPAPELRMPAAGSSRLVRLRPGRPRFAMLAASIGAFAIGAVLATALPLAPPSTDLRAPAAVSATIVDLHDRWADALPGMANEPDGEDWAWPIMAAAHLSPAFSREETEGVLAPMRQDGYVGQNGCRASLFSVDRPGSFAIGSLEDGVSVTAWSHGGRQFALVARAMDPKRFALLAGSLREGQSPPGPPEALLAAVRDRPTACS